MSSTKHDTRISYDLALFFWRTVATIFFREIRPRGTFNIPRDGPVIFVGAPHGNQFLDPILLSQEVHRETRRRVRFLTAAKSMDRKYVGFFARLMDSIPVSRAADYAKTGTGRVSISDDDPCLVIGERTKFTTEFKPQMQIMLPKYLSSAVAEVLEVISDTQLKIKREFGGESGKVTSRLREKVTELNQEDVKGVEFKTMPYVDQQEMYRHVYSCLTEGGSIGIFPEGGSHDRTDLLPLKAGVSLMALGAMANNPTVKVKIVPVGLAYFHAHRFRSRAVVEFGNPMDVPSEYVEMFREGGARKREAVGKFLDLIYDGLKTVTVRAPDYDTLMLIQAVRRLYKTPGQHLSLGQVVEMNRRFLEGYTHFKDEPRVQQLRTDVLKYNRLVRDLGLRDHQVPRAQKAGWKTLGLLTYRLGLLLVWTVLALPGTILNGPMFILASIISKKKQKEALAGSNVKIAARDVLATWKVLISLGIAPLMYGFYAFLATLVAIKANAPLKWKLWTPFLVIIALPFMNFAALKFGEAGVDVLKSLRPLIMALIPGQQRSLDKLKIMRERLSNEVADVINDFGPKLYDDFEDFRMIAPAASAPPVTQSDGSWRRKSNAGVIDAQGNLLIHPMSWLDERLFGWSRSAKRGSSAWGGATAPSIDVSRVGSPDQSDEEEDDTGDLDNVVGYLRSFMPGGFEENAGLAPKSRRSSRNNSFADLQRLKMSGNNAAGKASLVVPSSTSPTDSTGLRHRNRGMSLAGDIPVERLAAVDRAEGFDEATNDLNEEVQMKKRVRD